MVEYKVIITYSNRQLPEFDGDETVTSQHWVAAENSELAILLVGAVVGADYPPIDVVRCLSEQIVSVKVVGERQL